MKKRILVLLALLLFLPFGSAFAETLDLLTGKPTTSGNYNLTDGITSSTITASSANPIIFKFDYAQISSVKLYTFRQASTNFELYLNGTKVYTGSGPYVFGWNTKTVPNITANEIRFITTSIDQSTNYGEGQMFGILVDYESPYQNVNDLSYSTNYNSISFSWENPTDSTGTKIYRNDSLITTLGATENTFQDLNLLPSTSYNYNFVSTYLNGSESPGVTKTVTTAAEPPKPGITGLEHENGYDSVSFTWDNPTEELFSGIQVYKNGALIDTLDHEVNTFSDSGLTPETSYNYEFIAVYSDGKTGEAAQIEITTDKEPTPILVEDGYTIESSGDFTFRWKEPTKGTVKILIDGVEYKTVNAEIKQITIPKEDMKIDSLGNPLVSLIPIGVYGQEGVATEIQGQNLEIPFTVTDLIKSGSSLFWYVSSFVLLALSFLLVPKFRNIIFAAFGKGKQQQPGTRRTEEPGTSSSQEKEPYSKATEKPIQREREVRELKPARISKRSRREPRERTRTETREPREPRTGRGRN
jgi:hypothetical protein